MCNVHCEHVHLGRASHRRGAAPAAPLGDAELMALDDRSLADIGIRRSQIRALVDGEDVRGREVEPIPSAKAAGLGWHKVA